MEMVTTIHSHPFFMLKLFTGVPGAGKTLNAIKHVYEQTREGEVWEGREVYYFNIPECVIEGWKELDDERINKWFELPTGSIIIVDECQQLYPPKDWKEGAQQGISKLDTHRHQGFDLVFITQHPKLLHTSVRRMVGEHWHFDRKFGMNQSTRYRWNSCTDDPKDFHSQKEAVKDVVRFDKKIFELYKSAEVHTHKRKLPKPLIVALLFIAFIPVVGWFAYDQVIADPEIVSNVDSITQPVSGLTDKILGSKKQELSTDEYQKLYQARVPGYPHTAPIYDDLLEAKTYPKYNCVDSAEFDDKCLCYSQQGTLHRTVPISVCKEIVKYGFFDVALEEREDNQNRINNQFLPDLPDVNEGTFRTNKGVQTLRIPSESGLVF